MVDKVAVSLAIVALILSGASLVLFSTVTSSVENLRVEQNTARTALEGGLSDLRSEVSAGREQLAEAEKLLEQAKAEEALLEAARREAAEGPMIIYGSMDVADMQGIVWPAFQAKYPFAPDVLYSEGFTPLMQRFQQEAARGVRTADVRLDSGNRAFSDLQMGLAQPYKAKGASAYEPGRVAEDTLYPSWGNTAVIIYNTNVVSTSDLPKSWFDLTNPKWKGKLAYSDPRIDGTAQLVWADLLQEFGEQRTRELIKGIYVDNQAIILENAGSAVYSAVLTGEVPIGISLANDVAQQKSGTPVGALVPTEGTPVSPNFAYIYKNTPKPNLAKLFLEWFISPEGQQKVGETGRSPAISTVSSPERALLGPFKILPTNQDNLKEPQATRQRFVSIFADLGIP